MINESYYWKKELLKLAVRLEKRKKNQRWWTESQYGTFEKEIMIGFYIIRKLLEAKKLTNAIVSKKIIGTKFPNNGTNVTLGNNHRFFELYDFEKPKQDKFDLIFLCNQLVHSYIFSPNFECDSETGKGEKTLSSILFCSDENRNKWLFEIHIDSVTNLFKELGNDYPNSYKRIYDKKRNDYIVTNSHTDQEIPKDIEDLIEKHQKEKQ